MHAVNVKEVGEDVDEHRLVRADLLESNKDIFDAGAKVTLLIRLAGSLLAVFQQRKAEHQPPHRRQGEDKGKAGQHRHADRIHDQEDQQRDRGAADIAEAVPQR